MSRGSNAGAMGEPPSPPGKGCHRCAGEELVSRAPRHEASFAGAFLSDQPREGAKPPPQCCSGHRVLIQAGTARSSMSLAPQLPPEPGQKKRLCQVCSHTPLAALGWPQWLITWQVPGQEIRANSQLSLPTWPCWSHYGWCPGPRMGPRVPSGDSSYSPSINMGEIFHGHCPSPGCSSLLLSPSCPERMALWWEQCPAQATSKVKAVTQAHPPPRPSPSLFRR